MGWRMQFLLTQHGGKLLLLGSFCLVAWLMSQTRAEGVPGYADATPIRIAAIETGTLQQILVSPGDVVEAGALLALLDDSVVQAEARILEAEAARHGAALADLEDEAQSELADARVELAEAKVGLDRAVAELSAREAELSEREERVASGLASSEDLARLEVAVATLRAEIPARRRSVSALQDQLDRFNARLGTAGEAVAPALLEQTRSRGIVQEQMALLEERRRGLRLVAPRATRVAAVHFREGEILPAQTVFAEFLPLQTRDVIACLPEQFADDVTPGSGARLYPQSGGEAIPGLVTDVVGMISEAPDRCKQRPNEVGWVRPVRISVESDALVPGQRFNVTFETGLSSPAREASQEEAP